jgi:hypothetical protein
MTALSPSWEEDAADKPICAKRDLETLIKGFEEYTFFVFYKGSGKNSISWELRFELKILNMAERYFRALILPNF